MSIFDFRALVRIAVLFACLVVDCHCFGQELPTSRSFGSANTEQSRAALAASAFALPQGTVDIGPVADDMPIHRLQLILTRTAAQQTELEQRLQDQLDSHSPRYHQWLTPEQFGSSFGPTDEQLAELTLWLTQSGFSEIKISKGRTTIELSGPSAAVKQAFHVSLHRYILSGETFYAGVGQPSVPQAVARSLSGFVSFGVKPGNSSAPGRLFRRNNQTGQVTAATALQAGIAHPAFSYTANQQNFVAIGPGDFAILYDETPLLRASSPIDGRGEVIAVAGESDINPADFVAFRSLFSLSAGSSAGQSGSSYLNIIYNGIKPAVFSEEQHADGDVQWAAGSAPGATIDYVASQTTEVSSGVALSAAYIVDNNLAPLLVDSYSTCELALGTSGNAFYNSLWQQAAAQGITVVASSGDSGAAGCEATYTAASKGKAVNGIASTAYNVAVGGTEFNLPNGTSSYVSPTNTAQQSSVLRPIPEAAWNESCADPLLLMQTQYAGQSAETACNQSSLPYGLQFVSGTGGGASACTSSDSSTVASCSGGHSKPSWQTGAGVPTDGVRDLPDVALFASKGFTNNFYIVCRQSANTDGLPCNLSSPYTDFVAAGGTELATPAFAGVLALVAQKTGGRLGNVGPALYRLAAAQVQAATSCDSSNAAGSCLFHDITVGNNSVPCVTGSPGCVTQTVGDRLGILTASSATVGYDTSTGLGSVDVNNLVNAWAALTYNATTAQLTLSPTTAVHGSPISATVTVSGTSSVPTGLVALDANTTPALAASGNLNAGTFVQTIRSFPGGNYTVHAHYAGDNINAPADSNYVPLNISAEPSTTTLTPLAYNPNTGSVTASNTAPYGTVFYLRSDVQGQSGQGVATGSITLSDGGTAFGTGVSLNSSGFAEYQTSGIPTGTHLLASAYAGDASFFASTSPQVTVNITKAGTVSSLSTSVSTVPSSSVLTVNVLIDSATYGLAGPGGQTMLLSGSKVVALFTPTTTQDADFHTASSAIVVIPASLLFPGANSLTIRYPGDANYTSSVSSAVMVNVVASSLPATSTTASATPSKVPLQGVVQFSAAISSGTSGSPTGQVQFQVDGANAALPVILSGGSATLAFAVKSLTVGQHTLQAVYLGDSANSASVSSPVSFSVTSPTITSLISLALDPLTVTRGTATTVSGQVSPSGSLTPTGVFQVSLDGNLGNTLYTLTNGSAQFTLGTATLAAGTHSISLYYSGDDNFKPGSSPVMTLTITAPSLISSAILLSGLPSTIVAGTNTSVTVTVTPVSPTPTGTLQVLLDNSTFGPAVTLNGSVNTLPLATPGLTVGTHIVSVLYSGDVTYNAASATQQFSVIVPVQKSSFSLTPATVSVSANRLSGLNPSVLYSVASSGFTGTITFSCSGALPAHATCVFSQPSTALTPAGSATTTLSVHLNGNAVAAVSRHPRPGERFPTLISFAGIVGALSLGRHRYRARLSLFVVCLFFLAGCGSGLSTELAPAGTYQFSVDATSMGQTESSIVTLTIQ